MQLIHIQAKFEDTDFQGCTLVILLSDVMLDQHLQLIVQGMVFL
jgi:hypothetical protein